MKKQNKQLTELSDEELKQVTEGVSMPVTRGGGAKKLLFLI